MDLVYIRLRFVKTYESTWGHIDTIAPVCVYIDFSFLLLTCIFQVHRKYTGEDFDEDLRTVLRRSGCKNEKIAFIMDESNVLDSGFLERMNTLLANER